MVIGSACFVEGMFTSWTMKLSLALLKYIIGHCTCLGTILVYIKEKNVRVTMEFEVPKRFIFRPILSTVMIQWVLSWEKQKRFSRCRC